LSQAASGAAVAGSNKTGGSQEQDDQPGRGAECQYF